jgi:carbon dioxide concentrating mechanism protein CcmM
MILVSQDQADRLPDVQPADLAFAREILGVNQTLRSSYLEATSEAGAEFGQPVFGTAEPAPVGMPTPIQQSNERDGLTTMQSQRLTSEIVQQVRQLLNQGYRVGMEHADTRRYRSGVWQTCPPIQANREGDVLAALEACLAEHAGEYVRMFGIDPVAKRRIASVTIQHPNGQPVHFQGGTVSPAATSGFSTGSASPAAAGSGMGADVAQQVRQLLNQGYRVGMEHADARRYRSGVWQTCPPAQSNREADVMAAIQACLAQHQGEYVRIFGIDPVAKRRIAPVTIQQPGGKPVAISGGSGGGTGSPAPAASQNGFASGGGTLTPEVIQQVRQLLSQGYRIGTEHTDTRRYRSGVWQTCSPIQSNRESDVLAALQGCLQEHSGEYVRMFGIDPKAKNRIAPITIQRPDGKVISGSAPAAPAVTAAASAPSVSQQNGSTGSQTMSADLLQQVHQLINQGYRVSLEHADVRRYRSGAWQTVGMIEGSRPADVMATVEARLRDHRGEYVRLVGIDPKAKRRVLETTIQRP